MMRRVINLFKLIRIDMDRRIYKKFDIKVLLYMFKKLKRDIEDRIKF